MRAASEKLGGELEILSFQDCQVLDTYDARLSVAAVVRKFRPKLVFAPYHTNPGSHTDGSAHPDHMATGAIVRSALRYARFAGLKELAQEPWNASHLFYYMVPLSRAPTLVNDVSPFMEEWEDIARCHESQVKIREGKILQILRAIRAGYGVSIGVTYGEAFLNDEPLPFDIASFLHPLES
jgi:LmbE family N-acetylglucosaminyl deacetylase